MYLLDTNICIFLIKNKYPALRKRIRQCNPHEVFLSSISVAEMEHGAAKSAYHVKK